MISSTPADSRPANEAVAALAAARPVGIELWMAAGAVVGVVFGTHKHTAIPGRLGIIAIASIGCTALGLIVTSAGRLPRALAGVLLIATVTVLAADAGERSFGGLTPAEVVAVADDVVLVTDPERRGRGVVADVRLDDKRYEVWAFGRTARVLEFLLAGEAVHLVGSTRPFADPWVGHRPRHVIGRIDVDLAWRPVVQEPSWMAATTNGVRRLMVDGAVGLDPVDRALLMGFTVGDDRELPTDVVDDFRAAGLSHLTAVSGQNVVLLLALVAPMTTRMHRAARSAAVVVLLVWFGTLTRWEPSVTRAIVMAGMVVAMSPASGARSRLTVLSVAVTALVLIDPMLVWSVGFRLSVGATAGIIVLAPIIESLVPGPKVLTSPLAITAAAQLGVAPVQLATFGPIPLASLPANLAAGAAAAPLMTWGAIAGPIAGLSPPWLARLLHVPTVVLTRWVSFVAHAAADSGLPRLDWRNVSAVVVGIVAARFVRSRAQSDPTISR